MVFSAKMHPDWAKSLRDRCTAAGAPFHFKQWGSWKHGYGVKNNFAHIWPDGTWSREVDKKAAGGLLDGRTWDSRGRHEQSTAYDDFFAGFGFGSATGSFATLDENLPSCGGFGLPRILTLLFAIGYLRAICPTLYLPWRRSFSCQLRAVCLDAPFGRREP